MNLTEEEIELIRTSYLRAAHDLQRAGEVFYTRLFEIAPGTRSLFVTDIDKQAGKLMSTLGLVVSQLQNWQEMTPMIEDLAMRHLAYGVQPEHYVAVREALHFMFDELLDHEYSDETRSAWDRAYGALSDEMIETAYRERDPIA